MRSNEAFYKRPIEEDVFHACFRAACPGDLNVHPLSAASIFQILKEKNPAAMRSSTASNFGKVLTALHIERKHTRLWQSLSSSAAHPSHVSQDLAVAQANAANETYVIEIIPST